MYMCHIIVMYMYLLNIVHLLHVHVRKCTCTCTVRVHTYNVIQDFYEHVHMYMYVLSYIVHVLYDRVLLLTVYHSDMEFPTDLEQSFHSGALSSTVNATMPAHTSPLESCCISLPSQHLHVHVHSEDVSGITEDVTETSTIPRAVQKEQGKLHEQQISHQRLVSHNCAPVVPDRDELLQEHLSDSVCLRGMYNM